MYYVTNAGPPWYYPLLKALRAGAFLLAHTLVAVVLIGLVTLVAKVVEYAGDHRLLGYVRISYIFDLMDFAIFLVFITFGFIEAVEAFRSEAGEHTHLQRPGHTTEHGDSRAGAQQVGDDGAGRAES